MNSTLIVQLLDLINSYQAGTVALRRVIEAASNDDLEMYHLEIDDIDPTDSQKINDALVSAGLYVPMPVSDVSKIVE